jgi:exonuclease III
MRFDTWNVRSLYRARSWKTVARELGKYKIDLVGVQEVRWEKKGTERAEEFTFFYGIGNEDHQIGTGFFVQKRIISGVRREEFVSDRMSYILLRGRWCNIVVLNVHAPCEDKSDDVKKRFYEELARVFDQFPRYNVKILLGDFNAKEGRQDIFKPTIGNESSHEKSNDNGVRVHVKCVHCHHGMARPRVADRGDGLQIWRVDANILNKQTRTADCGWYSSLGVGRGANNPPP